MSTYKGRTAEEWCREAWRLRQALERVGGHAGDPDPLRGCQTVVKVVREALESDHAFLVRMNRQIEAQEDTEDLAYARKAAKDVEESGTVSWDDVKNRHSSEKKHD